MAGSQQFICLGEINQIRQVSLGWVILGTFKVWTIAIVYVFPIYDRHHTTATLPCSWKRVPVSLPAYWSCFSLTFSVQLGKGRTKNILFSDLCMITWDNMKLAVYYKNTVNAQHIMHNAQHITQYTTHNAQHYTACSAHHNDSMQCIAHSQLHGYCMVAGRPSTEMTLGIVLFLPERYHSHGWTLQLPWQNNPILWCS